MKRKEYVAPSVEAELILCESILVDSNEGDNEQGVNELLKGLIRP